MERRHFLTHSLASVAVATEALSVERGGAAPAPSEPVREFYELRNYTLDDDVQRKMVEEYLEKAFIPAMNRLGCNPIGVFVEQRSDNSIWVFIPYSSLDQFLTCSERLLADKEHNEAGAAYLNVQAPNKAYERITSSLLRSFSGMAKMELPPQSKAKKPRLLQMRTYASNSEVSGKKKVEMFNNGEIDIFKRIGANPVFFGENILGLNRPSLTYMLAFDDKPNLDKVWGIFGHDPMWMKMKSIPEYSDKKIVSEIINLLLNPAPYSQI